MTNLDAPTHQHPPIYFNCKMFITWLSTTIVIIGLRISFKSETTLPFKQVRLTSLAVCLIYEITNIISVKYDQADLLVL